MPPRSSGLQVLGLRRLTQDLGRISKDFRLDAVRHLREIGKKVYRDARSEALERGVTGELGRSYRVSAGNRGTAITSRLPQAGVIEFGGQISPRGTPFTIEPHAFITGPLEEQAGDIEEQFGDLLDRIARGNGFPLP